MPIRIDKVVTRGGDKGETSLANGERVKKNSAIIEAIGAVDELNTFVGFAGAALSERTVMLKPILESISQELFDLGAVLSRYDKNSLHGAKQFDPIFANQKVTNLDLLCETYNRDLPKLNSFVLPGGSELSSRLHLARTACRYAERRVVELLEHFSMDESGSSVTSYLNRLSDLFFILSRFVLAREGLTEILWIKESERGN